MPDKPQLGEPHHLAYLVDSIEQTVQRLAAQVGAGPFFLVEDVPLEHVVSHGEPARLDHNSAFGALGGAPIELLELKHAAPERVQARWSGPLPRVHHVGYALAPDKVERARDDLPTPYLSSQLGELKMSFHDVSAMLGHDIEMLDDVPAFQAFFGLVRAAAEDWDGTDPLRPAPS